jgi:chemotaxis protein CheD
MMEENQYKEHYLYPADLYVSTDPYLIKTILGSCVAVCMYDPKLQFGGMNHYMLPIWAGQGLASPKFGNIAIEKLAESLIAKGAKKERLNAKVFGGGEVLESSTGAFKIGERNAELAFQVLDTLKIRVAASHVGGKLGRKILFNNYTFEVRMKMIEKNVYSIPEI